MQLYMIELTVTDITNSQAWYEQALGLVTTLTDNERQFRLLEAPGGGRIALKQGKPHAGSVALQFEVSDLLVEMQRLQHHGIEVQKTIKTSSEGYRRILLQDPDGHLIGLFDWHAPKTSTP
jgi:predicted enzyme related to lactoylglutathione lyase